MLITRLLSVKVEKGDEGEDEGEALDPRFDDAWAREQPTVLHSKPNWHRLTWEYMHISWFRHLSTNLHCSRGWRKAQPLVRCTHANPCLQSFRVSWLCENAQPRLVHRDWNLHVGWMQRHRDGPATHNRKLLQGSVGWKYWQFRLEQLGKYMHRPFFFLSARLVSKDSNLGACTSWEISAGTESWLFVNSFDNDWRKQSARSDSVIWNDPEDSVGGVVVGESLRNRLVMLRCKGSGETRLIPHRFSVQLTVIIRFVSSAELGLQSHMSSVWGLGLRRSFLFGLCSLWEIN